MASTVVDHIMTLFRERGDRQYGEDVTQRMHALQCAALAQRDGLPPTQIAAAFLHDIGHVLTDLGEDAADQGIDDLHEDVGDRWLRQHFPPEVTEPVRLHVEAKRYLCAVEPAYRSSLSEASEKSLMLQGGPMSEGEIASFESNPHYQAAVQLRRYDDWGKDPTLPEVDIEHFRPFIEGSLITEPTG